LVLLDVHESREPCLVRYMVLNWKYTQKRNVVRFKYQDSLRVFKSKEEDGRKRDSFVIENVV